MAKDLGKIRKLFLKASAPSSAFDSSEYSQFLLAQTITYGLTRAEHDVSTMDDVFEQALLSGRRTMTVTIQGLFNFSGDTGQEIAETAILADTQAASKIWFLWTTDVAGDKERAGTAIVTDFSTTDPDEGPATISVTLRINTGDVTIQDVS